MHTNGNTFTNGSISKRKIIFKQTFLIQILQYNFRRGINKSDSKFSLIKTY